MLGHSEIRAQRQVRPPSVFQDAPVLSAKFSAAHALDITMGGVGVNRLLSASCGRNLNKQDDLAKLQRQFILIAAPGANPARLFHLFSK